MKLEEAVKYLSKSIEEHPEPSCEGDAAVICIYDAVKSHLLWHTMTSPQVCGTGGIEYWTKRYWLGEGGKRAGYGRVEIVHHFQQQENLDPLVDYLFWRAVDKPQGV